MKIKEVDRTANVAWSPANHHPIYLAAGTAAQQLDATFSTSAALEIYALNLTEPGLDMGLKGSLALDHRFNKIVWGCHGMDNGDNASGVIVGGTDTGNIFVYNPDKLIKGEEAKVFQGDKHSGAIYSMDFNPFQSNLLVSGAVESEIMIWDLNNPGSAMNPGAKSQPLEEVSCVAWNRQVQHILASTFPARCVVWDLRKNEPIIKVSDATARLRCKVVAWHPEVATQLCLASEDDHCPVIQLWDLRFATSPLKTLESHQRGVLSIAWCQHDPDLLLSCGKDNRILCWNPNTSIPGGEVVCELPTNNQWSFEVAWCPRNPAVIASSSFDGHVSIYSLMGGQQQIQPCSKIAEAFPIAENFNQPVPVQTNHRSVSMPLQKPPKWLRRPVGAVFGFGGKLVSFGNEAKPASPSSTSCIQISQVVTEPAIVQNASGLQETIQSGNLSEFCQKKIQESAETNQRMIWSFLNASFQASPRSTMLSLLGYDPQKIAAQLLPELKDTTVRRLSQDVNSLDLKDDKDSSDSSTFDEIANDAKSHPVFQIKAGEDEKNGLLARALLTGNIEAAVQLCIQQDSWADALLLAQAGDPELLSNTQKKYLSCMASNTAQLISAVVTSDWLRVVKYCDLDCWKEALAAVLTYAKPEEFSFLCEALGRRLELEKNGVSVQHAMLCYVCAGNLENLTDCWLRLNGTNLTSEALQDLVEQIMVLKKTVELLGGQAVTQKSSALSHLLGKYVVLLASQGSLSLATTFIDDDVSDPSLNTLKDRIYVSLGVPNGRTSFQKVSVNADPNLMQQYENKIPRAPQPQHVQRPQQYQPMSHQPQPFQPPSMQYNPSHAPMPAAPSYEFFNPSAPSQPSFPPLPNLGHSYPQSAPTPPPPPPAEGQISGPATKGHLSQRYPRHVQDQSVYNDSMYGGQSSMYNNQPSMYGHQQGHQQNFNFNQQQQFNNQFPNSQLSSSPQSFFNLDSNGATSFNQPGSFNPIASGNFVPSVNPSMPQGATVPFMESKPGWNDPPPLKTSARKQSISFEPNPHLMNPVNPQQDFGAVPQHGYGQPVGNFALPNQQPITTMQPAQLQMRAPTPQAPPIAEPLKEKEHIPPEHQVLQDIFEDLRQQCYNSANNPQIRRKLDDVARKLENLYDKLRENGLSQDTTLSLHQIIQCIQSADYQTALAIHTHLVSSNSFAETSSFVLGLKVLLQTAQQLQVYLR